MYLTLVTEQVKHERASEELIDAIDEQPKLEFTIGSPNFVDFFMGLLTSTNL